MTGCYRNLTSLYASGVFIIRCYSDTKPVGMNYTLQPQGNIGVVVYLSKKYLVLLAYSWRILARMITGWIA